MNPKIEDILKVIKYLEFKGNRGQQIKSVMPLQVTNHLDEVLMWVNEKNVDKLAFLKKGTVICPASASFDYNDNVNYIFTEKPREAFRNVLEHFFMEAPRTGIQQNVHIHESVVLGENCYIGNNVVIEKDCKIGDNCQIDHNSVIKHGTLISNKVTIGANCTIGGVGFGYEKDSDGLYIFMPHLGNVFIDAYVEIGNNVCIDRAVLGSTHLSKNVKVDNFVHVAHGVFVDENSLLIAHSMIAGSTRIGKNVWVAPSSSIINACQVGDNATIGMGAVVLKQVEEGKIVVGNPARPIN
jgi:UDP-3-O-[3-hydroxymyristoyl] glucosamine N-acyltransferase